jgi:hypothetical protein
MSGIAPVRSAAYPPASQEPSPTLPPQQNGTPPEDDKPLPPLHASSSLSTLPSPMHSAMISPCAANSAPRYAAVLSPSHSLNREPREEERPPAPCFSSPSRVASDFKQSPPEESRSPIEPHTTPVTTPTDPE